MLRFIFLLSLILLFHYCISQTQSVQIVHHNDPKYKSFLIGPGFNSNFIDEGTGFILKRKNRFFLVTNYHVMSGRSNEDTSLMTNPNFPEPNFIKIRFHGKNETVVDTGYYLTDNHTRRLFLSLPADKKTRKTVDLAFFEIKYFPRNSEIDPIDINKINRTWKIPPTSNLFLCGYAFIETDKDIFPRINVINAVPDTTFSFNSEYILTYSSVSLKGGSGSPVYIKTNDTYTFMGIHSGTIPPNLFITMPHIIKNKKFTQAVSVTLGAKNIFLLNLLDKNNP